MKYIWTEDTGAGLHYWKLVNQYLLAGEYIVLAFKELIHWTGCGRKDKIAMREHILHAMNGHRIDLDQITDEKTLQYLMGFRRYSTERVMKSLVNELTDQKKWSIKGSLMGECWYQDCCVMNPNMSCDMNIRSGKQKVLVFLHDYETDRILDSILGEKLRVIEHGTNEEGL